MSSTVVIAALAQEENSSQPPVVPAALWDFIKDTACSCYENGSFDEDQEDDVEYLVAEIINQCNNLIDDGQYPELADEWQALDDDLLSSWVAWGEETDWEADPQLV